MRSYLAESFTQDDYFREPVRWNAGDIYTKELIRLGNCSANHAKNRDAIEDKEPDAAKYSTAGLKGERWPNTFDPLLLTKVE